MPNDYIQNARADATLLNRLRAEAPNHPGGEEWVQEEFRRRRGELTGRRRTKSRKKKSRKKKSRIKKSRKKKSRRKKTVRRQNKKKSFFHPKWRRKSGKKVKIYKSKKKQ